MFLITEIILFATIFAAIFYIRFHTKFDDTIWPFIENKIDQILELKNNEWEKEVKNYNQIMKFDYDNTIFKDEIKKLL